MWSARTWWGVSRSKYRRVVATSPRYNLSGLFFMVPFNAVLKTQTGGTATFEWSVIVAPAVYALLGWGIVRRMCAITARRSSQTVERVERHEDMTRPSQSGRPLRTWRAGQYPGRRRIARHVGSRFRPAHSQMRGRPQKGRSLFLVPTPPETVLNSIGTRGDIVSVTNVTLPWRVLADSSVRWSESPLSRPA
jgi:hypothetical protein